MKAIVCGGRDYGDKEYVFANLDEIAPTLVVHGAARGADQLADEWAVSRRVPVIRYPAEWHLYGRAAGAIRNANMLTERPAVVIAFPGGKGTANMIAVAKAAGVKVIEL